MLDVIVTDNRPHSDKWHARCIASVQAAIEQAGFPCNLVVTPGNLKNIAAARMAGFDKTTAEYVTWVVDFDHVAPDAFSALGAALDGTASAVFGRELHETGRVRRKWPHRHHLAIYRRDIVESVRHVYMTKHIDVAVRAAHEAAEQAGAVSDIEHHGYVRNMDRDVVKLFQMRAR